MREFDVYVPTKTVQPNGRYDKSYRVLATTPQEAKRKVKAKTGKNGRAYLVSS